MLTPANLIDKLKRIGHSLTHFSGNLDHVGPNSLRTNLSFRVWLSYVALQLDALPHKSVSWCLRRKESRMRHILFNFGVGLSLSIAIISANSEIVVFSKQSIQPAINERWEGVIEDARRPVVINVDFKAKRLSLNGGSSLNISPDSAIDSVNRVKFELVNGPQILKFAGTRNGSRITGELNNGNRVFPFWLELLPSLPKARDRVEAWQQDIDAVIARFLRYDRSFSERRRLAARAALENLRSNINRLSDQAVIVALARAVAISGNAHTRLYLMRNRTEVRRVPLRVWWFGNELRIIRAANANRDLLGCRINNIGQWNVRRAFQKVEGIKAGNASWQRYMSVYSLTSPDILFGAGVLENADRLPLGVNCDGKNRMVTLQPLPLRRATSPVEAWWDLSPAYRHTDGLISALEAEKAPRYLQHPDRNYWAEYLEEPAVIYIQFNRAQEMSAAPVSDLIKEVTALLEKHSVKGLIVDVRFNTGGDAGVSSPLVEALTPRLKGMPVIVLTSRTTFSAGITLAAQLKQHANASVVGEPVGDDLDLWSEGGNLLLPNSGLTVHYANGFHTYSQKEYPAFKPYFSDLNVVTLMPNQVVEPTWSEYWRGEDPVLEVALRRIHEMHPKKNILRRLG